MEKISYNKIFDFHASANNPITGGRINEYWKTTAIKKVFKTKRKPEFKFAENINYLDQLFICKQYNLKGFEYGNWVTQEERYNFLICSHIALSDLAKIMQFKNKNIGLNGKIGIAFGARGLQKASAHFEPSTFMINLTKKKGWHSLAHEYGHAIDFYFGGYYDQDANSYSLSNGRSIAKVVNLISYKKDGIRYCMNDLINSINTVVVNGKIQNSESFNKLLANFEDDYWFRRTEIFARFFERYIMYKLNKLGIRNTFLSQEKYEGAAYITNTDFKRVLPKMEKLLKAIQKVY